MEKQPKTVCLCGSVRFRKHFEKVDEFFTLNGWIVLRSGCWKHEEFHDPNDLEMLKKKEMLDALYRAKIRMSDLVFIINPDGYVGHSTVQELDYAKFLGKPIEALENGSKNWLFALNSEELLMLVKRHEKFPFCPNIECMARLEKRVRDDEMDSDYWFWCQIHGWVYGDDVKWMTEAEQEREEAKISELIK